MGDPLTPEQLAEIEERCERATPGPWRWDDRDDQLLDAKGELLAFGQPTYEGNHGIVVSSEDAEFIAAARVDVPALLAEVRRLQGELKMRDIAPVPAAAPNVQRAWEAYDEMRNEVRRLTAEVERMRPVVDAAIAQRDESYSSHAEWIAATHVVHDAVDAYRKAKP